jgi:ribosomal RNA assembly protein
MKDFIKIPDKRRFLLKKNPENKEMLEEMTRVKIEINDEISIEGDTFNVYQAKQILKAFGRGFEIKETLYLLEDDYGLEVINLSSLIKSRKRLKTLKGRIIGTEGKTKDYIEKLTDVKISVLGKTVSIIGHWNKINIAKEAIMKIVNGCSHQTLYRWLEQESVKEKW